MRRSVPCSGTDLRQKRRTTTKWSRQASANVVVTVHDVNEVKLSGASVAFTWTGGYAGSGTCTTSRKGTCTATSGAIPLGATAATLTITSVEKAGELYTPGLNHDPDADSDGTRITVSH